VGTVLLQACHSGPCSCSDNPTAQRSHVAKLVSPFAFDKPLLLDTGWQGSDVDTRPLMLGTCWQDFTFLLHKVALLCTDICKQMYKGRVLLQKCVYMQCVMRDTCLCDTTCQKPSKTHCQYNSEAFPMNLAGPICGTDIHTQPQNL